MLKWPEQKIESWSEDCSCEIVKIKDLYQLIDFFFKFFHRQSHALLFAAVSGVAGISLLACEVNTLTALLGGANLILYTLIYTPMKRISILNTWVGSIGKQIQNFNHLQG